VSIVCCQEITNFPPRAPSRYAAICAAISERFGTRFKLEITGNCAVLAAELEGGIQLVITDCEGPLSPFRWHLDGRAATAVSTGEMHRRSGDIAVAGAGELSSVVCELLFQ
jgi:hypothetical protein